MSASKGNVMVESKLVPISYVKSNPHNVRTHSKKQVGQIAESIKRFGFVVPIVVDELGEILAGHGRYEAAKFLKLKEVPVVPACGLSETQKRAFMLADNKIPEGAGWDTLSLPNSPSCCRSKE